MTEYDGFAINDRVTVKIEWADETKGKRAQIIGLQKNGSEVFAKLLWLGPSTRDFAQQYGTLFSLKELKKVT